MWRFVARGIRTIFERKLACHTNVYSRLLQDKNNEIKMVSIHEQKSLRVLITRIKSFYESTKNVDANNQSNSNWNANHTWTEAVGWSSILAAGWIVCQTLCLHKTFFDRENSEMFRNKFFNCAEVSNITHIVAQILNIQASHILPVINRVDSSRTPEWQDTNSWWNKKKMLNPLTIEEELKKLANEL